MSLLGSCLFYYLLVVLGLRCGLTKHIDQGKVAYIMSFCDFAQHIQNLNVLLISSAYRGPLAGKWFPKVVLDQ